MAISSVQSENVETSIFMVRLALGIIRMSVEKWVLYIPVKLNLPTRERVSAGTQKRVESINAVVFFRGVIITKKATRSLAGIAGIVAVATLISKVFGLVRRLSRLLPP
jgi:putative peptidoglycan lipid II flippase